METSIRNGWANSSATIYFCVPGVLIGAICVDALFEKRFEMADPLSY